MKNKQTLIEIIEACAAEPYKKPILAEIKPSIRLKTTGEAYSGLGKTKLGGCPDLPKGISWPKSEYEDKFLSFLGQINFAEVCEFDETKLLPSKGILYFFFNLQSGDDGKVIFVDELEELEKAIPPEEFEVPKKSFWERLFTGREEKKLLKESQVEIYKEYNFPSWDSYRLEKIQKETGTDIKPIDAFGEGIFDIYEPGETETTSNHHLLGNYQGIQNEFHESGFLDIPLKDVHNITIDELERMLKWKLLFQCDSDDNLELSWGDWGRIYFFIHEDDLKKQNFENTKISVDCY